MVRTWLITGGSGGLGRALAQRVLDGGDRAVVTSRDPAALRDLVEEFGDRVTARALDVTDVASAQEVVDDTLAQHGTLDVVVNNAGFAASSSVEDFPAASFRDQVEINLFGVVNVTRAALPVLRRQRSGHFLQVSSIGGRVGGTPGLSAYQTAKFGVEGFSEALAAEVAPLGIKVTIIEPGGIRTNWAAGAAATAGQLDPDYEQTVGAWIARFGDFSGSEPGDPARMAQAMADVVEAPNPPRRLLLGSDALDIALRAEAQRTSEAWAWAEVSRSTDYPTTDYPSASFADATSA